MIKFSFRSSFAPWFAPRLFSYDNSGVQACLIAQVKGENLAKKRFLISHIHVVGKYACLSLLFGTPRQCTRAHFFYEKDM